MKRTLFIVLAAGAAAFVGAAEWLRRQPLSFGVSATEARRAMPGDDLVPDANYIRTGGITIDADPEDLFPWLAQMGYERGGLYSYDFLDRLFGILDGRSSKEVLPRFQHLEAGDEIPLKRGGAFVVREVEPKRSLVLAPSDEAIPITWQMLIEPVHDGQIRFITRNRAQLPKNPFALVTMALWDVAAFIMVRRWLVVLKGRAETLAAQRRAEFEESLAGAESTTLEAPLTEEAIVG
jgi:hypothetical protein